jgi:hypothetical protein
LRIYANIYRVNEPVTDNRVAPEDILVRAFAQRRVFRYHGSQWCGREESGLDRIGRITDVADLQSTGVPIHESEILQYRWIVGGEARELFGQRACSTGRVTQWEQVLGDLVLALNHRVGRVGDVDDAFPSPVAAERRISIRPIYFVSCDG